jgi:8-oxo-dGTP diphosphatase
MHSPTIIHVAIGLIQRDQQYLLSRRATDVYLGGQWEFPGGKLEPGETPQAALHRELREELGIDVIHSIALCDYVCHYKQLSVYLWVFRIMDFHGEALGREGQELQWVAADHLWNTPILTGNAPILRIAQLPRYYQIISANTTLASTTTQIADSLARFPKLMVRLRNKPCVCDYHDRAKTIRQQFPEITLLVDDQQTMEHSNADGIHQSATLHTRPNIDKHKLLALSCHNAQELEQARLIQADFVTLSPVQPTQTHAKASAIGWTQFEILTHHAHQPVFALGGISPKDITTAQYHGGYGVAGIRGWTI